MAICWHMQVAVHPYMEDRESPLSCGEVLFLPMSIELVWCSEGPSQASSSMGVSEVFHHFRRL
jgi:hypothetical protein